MILRIIEAENRQVSTRPAQGPEVAEQRYKDLEVLSRHQPDEFAALAEQLGVREAENLELNEVLRNELLFFAGLGIRSAVRFPYHEHVECGSANVLQDSRDIDAVSINLADAERWEKEGERDNEGPTEFSKEVEAVFTALPTRVSQPDEAGSEIQQSSERHRRARA